LLDGNRECHGAVGVVAVLGCGDDQVVVGDLFHFTRVAAITTYVCRDRF
jgi:hypothetical protein